MPALYGENGASGGTLDPTCLSSRKPGEGKLGEVAGRFVQGMVFQDSRQHARLEDSALC